MDAMRPVTAMDISGSGMAAERRRMEVIANNLANAQTTRTPGGGPFRRQEVVFAAADGLRGVEVADVVDDPAEPQRVYMPGHPDADGEGYVAFPNVRLPVEMVNLLTAVRAYEANLKAAQAYKHVSEQSLALLRGA